MPGWGHSADRLKADAAKGFSDRAFAIIAGGSLAPAERNRALCLAFRESLEHHNHRFKEAGGLTIPFNALFDYVLHLP